MGKKSFGRHGDKPAFRESDFAGRPPQEQAELSGSLNNLSQQMAASQELLQTMDVTPLVPVAGLAAAVPAPAAPTASGPHPSTDASPGDGTAAPGGGSSAPR
jgi:hypothetical protein